MLAAGFKPAAILVSESLDSQYNVIMARYFTSDLHLGSSLINKYAHRPFKDAKEALDCLTDNICKTCDCYDSLIHVGDFMLTGADRHDVEEDHGLDMSLKDYLANINPRVILLAGNHDDGHNCEADCKSMVLDLNQNYRNVSVGHYPSTSPVIKKTWSGRTIFTKHSVNGYQGWNGTAQKPHIHLCGHVHDRWKYYYDNKANVLNYNVGVDCHNYKPIRDAEITEDLDFIFTHHDFNNSWKMTCEDEVKWKAEIKLNLNIARTQRKHDRYLKKGLTEAECLRRKEEALRKKGLLKSK